MLEHHLLKKAYEFARLSMVGKKRYSGESFEDHGVKAAEILQRYDVKDPTTLAVTILHHCIEDGAAKIEDVEKEFNSEISSMLKTLDSLSVIKMANVKETDFVENLRKMFLYLAKDLRIVLIKLADLLDNLRTLQYIPKQKQKEVARLAIDIYAPLSERLGMGEMKGEIQDLAFPFLYPKEYKDTKKLLNTSIEKLEKRCIKIKATLRESLDEEKIKFKIESRAKHLYSLYLKLKRSEIDFDMSKIYDLIAFRVVVIDTEDCYRSLGIIHNIWKPVPGRLKDYIANPKPNGYQSIHTTVFGPGDEPFEIQIRTKKMHEEADFGVAAHWNYEDIKSSVRSKAELNKSLVMSKDKLKWVQNLRKWQEEITDNNEFLDAIKTDFFGQRIFVLTPRGDVKDLPFGATPIDFAYSVHSFLGDRAVSAKVNGKMVSLHRKLKSGDVVEIVVSKDQNKKPSRDWLNFVVTSHAKKHIKKAYKLN